jgi:hypothetical protein
MAGINTRPFTLGQQAKANSSQCLYELYVQHCCNDFTPTGKIKREKSSRLKEDFYRLTGIKISTNMLAKVTKKFKNGWVPHEDEKYMEWINESKENLK